MPRLEYIKVKNFKCFDTETVIDLAPVTLFAGPNNGGKTTVFQAAFLWSTGIRLWFEGQKEKREEVPINTTDLIQFPITDFTTLWNENDTSKEMFIEAKLFDTEFIVRLLFSYDTKSKLIFCKPTVPIKKEYSEALLSVEPIIANPVSAVVKEEEELNTGAIYSRMSQGNTSQIVRNICMQLFEKSHDDWRVVKQNMKLFFNIELQNPTRTKLSIQLTYRTVFLENQQEYDISSSGSGQLQTLLLLTYIALNKKAILMFDEPDSHLEILRQNHLFDYLSKYAEENNTQIFLVSHSTNAYEFFIAKEAKIQMLVYGKIIKKHLKEALHDYPQSNYFKTLITKNVFYVEGTTDIDILRSFANKLSHPAYILLNQPQFNYFVSGQQNNENQIIGLPDNFKNHFYSMKDFVPELKGIAVLDKDNKKIANQLNNIQENEENGLKIKYWDRYEIENYFITPKTVLSWAKAQKEINDKIFESCFNNICLKRIFRNTKSFNDYLNQTENLRESSFINNSNEHKLSAFLEDVFEEYKKETNTYILLSKGKFYQIIDFIETEDIDNEIVDFLDAIIEFSNISINSPIFQYSNIENILLKNDKLSNRELQIKLLKLIIQKSNKTQKELADLLDISDRQVRRYLKELKTGNYITETNNTYNITNRGILQITSQEQKPDIKNDEI